MDDLFKRLREAANPVQTGGGGDSWDRNKSILTEAAAALAEAQATIARLEALIAQESEFLDVVQAKKNDYELALGSIAHNTCCEGCQEAARVARAALPPHTGEGE